MSDVPFTGPVIPINKASSAESVLPSTFASQPSFTQKILNFQIQLAQSPGGVQPTAFAGQQGSLTGGTINISGARARCRIENATAPSGGKADIVIYGLSNSLINQLATLGLVVDSVTKNNIIVSAGAASNQDAAAANANGSPLGGFPVVFGGTIWFAYGDYNQMPEVPFRIQATTGLSAQAIPAAPTSYSGSTSIVSIMQSFADQLSVPLENNGVTGNLMNPYFPGSVMQQVYQAAEHAKIQALLVDGGTKLAIWPIYGSRTSQQNVPLISKQTGMIRSPSFSSGFLIVEFVYTPDVIFKGNIQVVSDNVPQANRLWTVSKLDLALDTLAPHGDWKATAWCWPANVSQPAPPIPTVNIG